MFQSGYNMMGFGGGSSLFMVAFPIIVLLAVWGLVWKAIALWVAARRGEKVWFVAILVLNTLGILEILYIFFFSKQKKGAFVETIKNAVNEPVQDVAPMNTDTKEHPTEISKQ